YFYDWLLARDDKLKVGMFSSYQDAVVSSVVGLNGAENEAAMLNISDEVHLAHPDQFKRYFIQGASHCIPDYYWKVDNITVWMWLTQLIMDDPNWKEVMD
ncbi:MAG: hypothetical protein LWX83_12100, partial [Anaerolineae bacterium]|nr:hypothetical protein [Anaerolineae bacterium]